MNEQSEIHSAQKNGDTKALRPVLIASQHTITDYPIFLRHLLTGLSSESIPTAFVCPPIRNFNTIIPPGVEVITHPVVDLPLTGYINRRLLVSHLEKFKPTLLHCLCENMAWVTKKMSRQLHLPYILTINSLQRQLRRPFVSLKWCAAITASTRSIADSIAKVHPRATDRIQQINIGTFSADSPHCFCDTSRLATIVTVCPSKNTAGFEKLLGAIRHLLINGCEFMLVVMAGEHTEKQLRKLLNEFGLSQITTIASYLHRWNSVLAVGDIFVQSQPMDTFNPVLLKAMSTGLAIATCTGGVDDLIVKDHNAAVFDNNDELSIYNCLERLLTSRETAQQLAANAQQYIKQHHSVSEMLERTIELYRSAQNFLHTQPVDDTTP